MLSVSLIQKVSLFQGVLPLEPAKVRGIAVVGPNSVVDTSRDPACNPYSGDYCVCDGCSTNHTVSILDGIVAYASAHLPSVVVKGALGCADGLNGTSTKGFAEAESLMRSAEISHVVVAVGLSQLLEGEGTDRLPSRFPKGLGLPGMQQELVDLAASVGKPLIVIVVAGGATPVPPHTNISAEIAALYPGMETGNAVADILFGAASPAGRLPFSIPRSAEQLPDYLDFSMVAKPFGRTFAWLEGEGSQPLHEYSFGLSYTRFAVSDLRLSPSALRPAKTAAEADASPPITVTATLTNQGNRTSDEVVQVYSNWSVHDGTALRVPVRQLVGFVRVHDVAPAEQREVQLTLDPKQFALVDSDGRRVIPAGAMTLSLGGSQPTEYSAAAGATPCVQSTYEIKTDYDSLAWGDNQHVVPIAPGVFQPLVNLGGVHNSAHASNYSFFLALGGRGIDTALTYGDDVQTKVARAIATSGVPRSEIFLTTKVPCCTDTFGPCAAEFNGTIAQDVARNTALLGQVPDLTLLHWPCVTAEETLMAWRGLEAALAAGHTRSIGVSNFNASLLAKLLPSMRIKPAVNQCGHSIGHHTSNQTASSAERGYPGGDDATVAFCMANRIQYSAYSPLGGLSGLDIFRNPTVRTVATAHNTSAAQVALKWLVQRNITIVTAANNPEYIAEDIDLFSWGDLSPEEMATLDAVSAA